MFRNTIFNELVKRFHENKLSHAFLLETNDLDLCRKDLFNFIKYISCQQEYKENCDSKTCNMCYLIDNGNLPSLIDVFPDGTQVKKQQVQDVMERFMSVPIFNDYNIYIINECEKLNVSSANSLLKFLEEPDDNIIGFYITNNMLNVISTIRSRCQEYQVYYEKDKDELRNIDNIVLYLNSIYNNADDILYNKMDAIKYYKVRMEWISFFNDMYYLINNRLKDNKNDYNIDIFKINDYKKLIKVAELVETVLKYLQSNGNIELILDKFVIEMRNIYA